MLVLCSFILGFLLLLLAGKAVSASDFELCDHPLADSDAAIAACTRLLERPSSRTKIIDVYNNRGVAKVRTGNLNEAIAIA